MTWKGVDQDGDESAGVALDGASGHNSRHIASKAHHHRYKRFAMQAYAVHKLIHDESGLAI